MKELCYHNGKEIYKDFAMFMSKDLEEMKELAKGNKEREAVMKDLERIIVDPEFVDYYDHEEYEQALKKEIEETNYKKGIEKGIEQGKKDLLKELINAGFSKEEISRKLNISLEDIN